MGGMGCPLGNYGKYKYKRLPHIRLVCNLRHHVHYILILFIRFLEFIGIRIKNV